MTIKRRISVYVSAAFSLLFGLGIVIVYFVSASYRQNEFENRLNEKALTTVNLLLTVKEIDQEVLRVIDKNSINSLYNEKTLIFNEQYELIYSSIDDASITWNKADLVRLKKTKTFFKTDQGREVAGIYFDFEEADYYVLIAAEDKYGNSKLDYLAYTLLLTYLGGTLLMWILTYIIVGNLTKPLDIFQKKINHISASELSYQLPIKEHHKDEITQLTRSFNRMLSRIEKSFLAQKEFTTNASHELRTPLSRIMLQVDNLLQSDEHSPGTRNYLLSISNNVNQLSELIDSLLLLAKNNAVEAQGLFGVERIDEIIFAAYAQVRKTNPDFKMHFEILEVEEIAHILEVKASKQVLEIAFTNIFRNAYQYSPDKAVDVKLCQTDKQQLLILIANQGNPLTLKEQNQLFQPFMRGANARHTHGSGLGLQIVKRILDYHKASIQYQYTAENTHLFSIIFRP
ncbi:signal transduction histidine kinase [Dyadobacter jejuensis]|uniref:histidine kinase n=1 Tax=Dyadobacter jejuensis TaxID=1082580 RepID=A0A316ASA6_9BACT|nr:HAMP domain-containing sensor histidine kinase [Dyadobacter jejuensis]PWJ60583.1 signal transduction histidine kinase [Dyadobacter jejuensis]